MPAKMYAFKGLNKMLSLYSLRKKNTETGLGYEYNHTDIYGKIVGNGSYDVMKIADSR